MKMPQFLKITHKKIRGVTAALLLVGASFGFGSNAFARDARQTPRPERQQVSAVATPWQFTPSRICDSGQLLRYVASDTVINEKKREPSNDARSLVFCEVNTTVRRALDSIWGQTKPVPYFYLAGSHSSQRDTPIGYSEAVELIRDSRALDNGILIADGGTTTVFGELPAGAKSPTPTTVDRVAEVISTVNSGKTLALPEPVLAAAPVTAAADVRPDTVQAAGNAPAKVAGPVVVAPPSDWVSTTSQGVTHASLRAGNHQHRINNVAIHGTTTTAEVNAIYHQQRMTANVVIDGNSVKVSNLKGGDADAFTQLLKRGGLLNELRQAVSDIHAPNGHGPAVRKVAANDIQVSFDTPVSATTVATSAPAPAVPPVAKAAAPLDTQFGINPDKKTGDDWSDSTTVTTTAPVQNRVTPLDAKGGGVVTLPSLSSNGQVATEDGKGTPAGTATQTQIPPNQGTPTPTASNGSFAKNTAEVLGVLGGLAAVAGAAFGLLRRRRSSTPVPPTAVTIDPPSNGGSPVPETKPSADILLFPFASVQQEATPLQVAVRDLSQLAASYRAGRDGITVDQVRSTANDLIEKTKSEFTENPLETFRAMKEAFATRRTLPRANAVALDSDDVATLDFISNRLGQLGNNDLERDAALFVSEHATGKDGLQLRKAALAHLSKINQPQPLNLAA